MYIPRPLFSSAYAHLKAHAHSTNPSILLLCALDTDSLCAARILTHLLKRDYIPHKIHPVAGYQELENMNNTLVRGNEELRFVICLGLGGMINLSNHLDLGSAEDGRNVECWVVDGRRPWNLLNVFAGNEQAAAEEGGGIVGGKVAGGRYGVGVGVGGIKCFDDGDIEEDLAQELVAFKALTEMPDVDSDTDSEDDGDGDGQSSEDEDEDGGVVISIGQSPTLSGGKRKRFDEPWGDSEGEADDERTRARRRRRMMGSNESSRESSPLIQRHTLLSHPSSRALASSPPPAFSPPPALSPSQQLPLPPRRPPTTAKYLRRKLRRLKARHDSTLQDYYSQGTWYGEPISGLMYSLASDLGREDNDLLWLAIIGVSSGEIIGRGITSGPPRKAGGLGWVSTSREDQIRGVLRDEVRRLNPPEALPNGSMVATNSSLQTTARSPSDTAIRLSPEYRFMLIRHWSLYDSMLHSSFLGTKLHIWSENGRKRLHKLLAKMGFSLSQCKQSYTHMDMDLKRSLRERLEKYAPLYGLGGIVREGFVRCWGFRGCLSAADVAYIIGGLLEMGKKGSARAGEVEAVEGEIDGSREEARESENWVGNFWAAYDALEDIESLKTALPIAMDLTRAILRTGTALIEKRQIRLLRAFRLAVVKEGPDVATFTHPNALSKLALWLAEAILEQEREYRRKKHLPLVVACLNERRGVYVVVGTMLGSRMTPPKKKKSDEEKKGKGKGKGKGKERKKGTENGEEGEEEEGEGEDEEEEGEDDDSDDDSDNDEDRETRRNGRNKFAMAFQEVANSTSARIRIDAFEATVVEVRKEDLAGFLEGLSLRNVIG